MAKIWHVVIDGKQQGPLSNTELKALADSGQLKPTDSLWKKGLAEWAPASKIKGLFPPSPPQMAPLPQTSSSAPETSPHEAAPSFPGLDPALDAEMGTDDDASDAWKSRESPLKDSKGFLGGLFKKKEKDLKELVINHRQRISRYFENGSKIPLVEVLDRLEANYSNRGFLVNRFATSLIVTKVENGSDDTDSPMTFVGSHINGFVRVAESGDSWMVSIKGEAFFWPLVMKKLMGAAGLFFFFAIVFWPCLCFIPSMLAMDEVGKIKFFLQEELKRPVEKLNIEFV